MTVPRRSPTERIGSIHIDSIRIGSICTGSVYVGFFIHLMQYFPASGA